jgi:hypothetical protein
MYDFLFVKCNDWSSSVTCGDEVSNLLNTSGFKSKCIPVNKYNHRIESKVVIVLKPSLEIIKNIFSTLDNAVVKCVDLIDYTPDQVKSISCKLVDIYICRTRESQEIHSKNNPHLTFKTIPHYISPSFRIKSKNSSSFRLGFFGSLKPSYLGKVVKSNKIVADKSMRTFLEKHLYRELISSSSSHKKCPLEGGLKAYNMHINIRPTPYKPTNKIIQAAYSKSNILCSIDAGGAIESLGEDYPYLCENNMDSVMDILKKAKSDFGGSRWKYGLEIMESVLQRYGDEAIINGYAGLRIEK